MHVFVMGPKPVYYRMMFVAILIGLCHVLIGAPLMAVLMFSIASNFADVHVALCVFGFHFFSAEAILFLNYANGMATPMRVRHRRRAHAVLQVCALALVITGTVMTIMEKGNTGSAHGLTGVIATTLAVCCLLSSPFALFGKGRIKLMHLIMGMPTFIMSSICLCFGFLIEDFKNWAGDTVVYILIGFVSFYTAIISLKVFLKCLSRL